MDAANLLKPMLARGEMHLIGATTLDEYRKHIEKDAALGADSRPSSSISQASRIPSRYCAASKNGTRCITECASRTPRWWRQQNSRTVILATAFSPTRLST